MTLSIHHVITNHLCTSCGTCAGVCPGKALEMVETPGGQLVPRLDTSLCNNCCLCEKVCPQISIPPLMKQYLANPYTGPILAAYLGQASDTSIAAEGQTGGLGRVLLSGALELAMADNAVCVVDNPQQPLRPFSRLAGTPEEVLSSSRSKYCPTPVNLLIRQILKTSGTVIFLGLGCHMQGLLLAMEKLPKLKEKIVLRIGLFCDRVLTYAAADFLVRCAGIKSQSVAQFDYRHKSWKGWPGDIRVKTHNGRIYNVPRQRRTGSRELFTPIHCRLCIDKLNALSDISLGDPYGLKKGHQVPTAAIVRTEEGKKLLFKVNETGRVDISAADSAKLLQYQNITKRITDCYAFGQEMLQRKYSLPAPLLTPPLEIKKNGSRSFWIKLNISFTLFADSVWGRRVINSIPPILIGIWASLRQSCRKWQRRPKDILRRIMNRSGKTRRENSQ